MIVFEYQIQVLVIDKLSFYPINNINNTLR